MIKTIFFLLASFSYYKQYQKGNFKNSALIKIDVGLLKRLLP